MKTVVPLFANAERYETSQPPRPSRMRFASEHDRCLSVASSANLVWDGSRGQAAGFTAGRNSGAPVHLCCRSTWGVPFGCGMIPYRRRRWWRAKGSEGSRRRTKPIGKLARHAETEELVLSSGRHCLIDPPLSGTPYHSSCVPQRCK